MQSRFLRAAIVQGAFALFACGATADAGDDGAPAVEVGDAPAFAARVEPTADRHASFPSDPVTPALGTVVSMDSGAGPYFLYVPTTYDVTHRTPTQLLLWMHGCGGEGLGETWTVSPGGAQRWITLSLGGRDRGCWDVDHDPALVMAALADVKTHLNVDARRVVIGGYSSGGDLAYKTAFYHARAFAGLLAENTSPFRDTGSTAAASIAAATWRFPIAHLAHLEDTVYPIDGVRRETDAVTRAGFTLERIERHGHHWDDDDDEGATGTMRDRRAFLLPFLDRGWRAPGGGR
jgi:predicted esterase